MKRSQKLAVTLLAVAILASFLTACNDVETGTRIGSNNQTLLLGDVNGDGVVDIKDGLEILRYTGRKDSIIRPRFDCDCECGEEGHQAFGEYNQSALRASLITPESQENGVPRVMDFLQIQMFLIGDERSLLLQQETGVATTAADLEIDDPHGVLG